MTLWRRKEEGEVRKEGGWWGGGSQTQEVGRRVGEKEGERRREVERIGTPPALVGGREKNEGEGERWRESDHPLGGTA